MDEPWRLGSMTQNGTLHYFIYKEYPKIGNSIKKESRAKWVDWEQKPKGIDLFRVMKMSKTMTVI